jgi:serine/threonine-protein kinase
VPGYAVEIDAATYRPPAGSHRYEKSRLAHWGLRVASGLIDQAVVSWPVAIPYEGRSPSDHRTALIAYGLVVTVVLELLVATWQGRTGRTPGKALLRLRLVDAKSGQPLGAWRSVGRRLAHLVDLLSCYLGFLWPLWDDQRQTFADKMVGSVVLSGEH